MQLASDTIILLANYINQKTNVNAEGEAVKNTKDFFVKVSAALPKMFY